MTPAFPITEARIVGLFVESVTYGINLVSFGFCLNALLGFGTKRKRINEINWPMTIISILIFVVSTLGICLAFWIVLRAFVFYAPSPSSALSDISYWALSAKSILPQITPVLGDSILIYRCWIVYQRRCIVVIASLLLWLGNVACTIGIIVKVTTLHKHDALISTASLVPWITSYWAITITINIITTALLVRRLWIIDRRTDRILRSLSSSRQGSNLRSVMRNILESGVLYTLTAFLTFVVYVMHSNGIYPVSAIGFQLTGVTFNLVIIRATRRNQEEDYIATLQQDGRLSFRLNSLMTESQSAPKQYLDVDVNAIQETETVDSFARGGTR